MSSGESGRVDGAGRLLAGRYRVVARLGRGGMGVVWRAVDEVLGREVAVKELRTFTDDYAPELADLRLRMQREARAAARVRHPGVVAVHDIAEVDGRPLIVMELIDGPSLDDVLGERGPVDPREAAGIGAKVMDALAAAHAVGVLHRDVKPGNILLERSGRVVLTDFGIATMDDPGDGSATHLTRSGELMGSLDYLAPERAQGSDPGPASDVWALGATLYAAVEGASPFRRTSTYSTLTAIVDEPLPEPHRAGPLTPVLRQLLDKRPESRPDADRACRLLEVVAQAVAQAPETDSPTTVLRGAGGGAAEVPGAGEPAPSGSARSAVGRQDPGSSIPPTGSDSLPPDPTPAFAPAPPPTSIPQGFGPPLAPVPHPTPPTGPMAHPAHPRRKARVLVAAAAAAVVLAGAVVVVAHYVNSGDSSVTSQGGSPQAQDAGAASPTARADAKRSDSAKPTGQGADGTRAPTQQHTGKGAETTTGQSPTPAPTRSTSSGGGGTGGNSTPTNGTSPSSSPAPACQSIGGGKYNCQVWRTAKSYTASGAEVGVLGAGTNYFYCQQNLGRRETYGQWTNVWWAKTDDDSGNTNVYVSDVYIKGGDNDEPVPGLPVC
ncbi:protein kinase [Streptomyces sp. NBC_01622]|uniref:serine/threonine-protein kinase n=1 Tax=Streptomyces sp. NBC_01622 TaxID=2975903 RepID=UPI00386DE00D|nr:protein kinase [Streptomyces sp. NBC_01622]